jgi:hypothetical protein
MLSLPWVFLLVADKRAVEQRAMRIWKAAPLVAVLLVICCLGVTCICPHWDYGMPVTVENRTSVPFKVYIWEMVDLDYTGTPYVESYAKSEAPVVLPGEVKKIYTTIPPGRKQGIKEKNFVGVITESDTILLQRFFTWDELNEMNWTIIIEPQ